MLALALTTTGQADCRASVMLVWPPHPQVSRSFWRSGYSISGISLGLQALGARPPSFHRV